MKKKDKANKIINDNDWQSLVKKEKKILKICWIGFLDLENLFLSMLKIFW